MAEVNAALGFAMILFASSLPNTKFQMVNGSVAMILLED